jgi:hypothetical protein
MYEWNEQNANTKLARVMAGGRVLQPGDRVRLRPKRRADAFDLLLAGRIATIVSIEQNFEDQVFLAVTVDDDPGREFGADRQPGHRFFYGVDEVEPVAPAGGAWDDRRHTPGQG